MAKFSSEDAALLLSAGLGLKRALHWTQVKGALVEAAYDPHGAADPTNALSERLGVTTLGTSMAPIRRFVYTAREIGLPVEDVTTLLDVASGSQNIGEVISALPEKNVTNTIMGQVRAGNVKAAGAPKAADLIDTSIYADAKKLVK